MLGAYRIRVHCSKTCLLYSISIYHKLLKTVDKYKFGLDADDTSLWCYLTGGF